MGEQLRMFAGAKVGYISARWDQDSHLGGLLVVDADGDPVEFVHTELVKLTLLMRTLLGSRMHGFVVTRLITGPLLSCCMTPPDIVCFDEPAVLYRRLDLNIPAAVLAPADSEVDDTQWQRLEPQHCYNSHKGQWWGQISFFQEVQSLLEAVSRSMSPSSLVDPFECLGEALKQIQTQEQQA